MKPQNLVFIMTDQQRADTIGMKINGVPITPELNKLAEKSAVFTKAYNCCPLCVPARTALATGINPIKSGMMLNDLAGKYAQNHKTLHTMLYEAGYDVAHIGVNHISTKPNIKDCIPFSMWEDDQSYEKFALENGVQIQRKLTDSVVIDELSNGKYEKHRYSNANVSRFEYALDLFKDVWFAQKAVEFINQEHDKPFALFICMWAPHPPLIVPNEYADIFRTQDIKMPSNTGKPSIGEPSGYKKSAAAQLGKFPPENGWDEGLAAHFNLTRLCDDQVGKVMTALVKNNLQDSTITVFTTDHGEQMGSHGMYQKMEMYEPAVRVPAIFNVPNIKPSRFDTPISHLDFVPTILNLLNIDTGIIFEGTPLGTAIKSGTPPLEHDIFSIYCGNHQYGDMRRMIVSGKLGKYKYVFDGSESELFDLETDPLEMNNLANNPDYCSIKQKLHEKLIKWEKDMTP